MNFFLVLMGFAGIAVINLPGMVKNKQWRDIAVYSAVFLLIFTFGVLLSLDAKVPSPIKAIQTFFRDVLHLSFKTS